MKLINILESGQKLKDLLKQKRGEARISLDKLLNLGDSNKVASYIEKAVLRSDLSKDQRFWEELARQLNLNASEKSDFRRCLKVALNIEVKDQGDQEEGSEQPEQRKTSALGGPRAAMNLYLQAYATTYNLPSLVGDKTLVDNNIDILENFLVNFVRSTQFKTVQNPINQLSAVTPAASPATTANTTVSATQK
jgi:hypothetical protein